MLKIDERLIEEVRKHENLYVTTLKTYKDAYATSNSWSAIAEAVDLSVPQCIKRWRSIRDKYVRLRRKMSSCDAGCGKKVPKLCKRLSWLSPHVKHRGASSNNDVKEQDSPEGDEGDDGDCESPVDGSVDDGQSSPTPDEATPAVTPPPSVSTSPLRPTFPSPLSRTRRKKRQQGVQQEADNFSQVLEELKETRLVIQRKLERSDDAITRFTQTMGDMLRKVPEEDRDATMHTIYNLLYRRMKRRSKRSSTEFKRNLAF